MFVAGESGQLRKLLGGDKWAVVLGASEPDCRLCLQTGLGVKEVNSSKPLAKLV